jgi:hypothetical protein
MFLLTNSDKLFPHTRLSSDGFIRKRRVRISQAKPRVGTGDRNSIELFRVFNAPEPIQQIKLGRSYGGGFGVRLGALS